MVLMAQDDDVAVPTLPSGKFDSPIGGGLYLGANRSTVIDSLVCAPLLQDGMKARQTESGSDAGEFQRRTQKRLADAFAVSRVVTPVARLIFIPRGLVRLSVIDEFCGQDAAGANWSSQMIDGLVHDRKPVSLAQAAMKVDVTTKNIGQLRRNTVGNSRCIRGAEQRVLNTDDFINTCVSSCSGRSEIL